MHITSYEEHSVNTVTYLTPAIKIIEIECCIYTRNCTWLLEFGRIMIGNYWHEKVSYSLLVARPNK